MIRVRIQPSDELPHVGFANQCSVYERNLLVSYTFFETREDARRSVRARVIVSAAALVSHIWDFSAQFYAAEQARLNSLRQEPIALLQEEPDIDIPAMPASVIRVFRSGPEGLFEFFHTSPRSLYEAETTGKEVIASPVFAVTVPSPMLVGFFAFLESKLDGFRNALGSDLLRRPD